MATNLQKFCGMDNIKVEIVAFGRGLEILTPESFPGSTGTTAHRAYRSLLDREGRLMAGSAGSSPLRRKES